MSKLKKNNVFKFPEFKITDQEKEIEAMKKADAGITRVFDKMRRGIPLNPDDQAALQGSGFKTALDNFKGFEPRVIQGGKSVPVKFPKNVKKDFFPI